MLLVSRAAVSVDGEGNVTVEGAWARHAKRITEFAAELGLRRAKARHRFGRIVFSGVEEGLQQRLRNFLVNECPVRD
jgi:hypothetical protein